MAGDDGAGDQQADHNHENEEEDAPPGSDEEPSETPAEKTLGAIRNLILPTKAPREPGKKLSSTIPELITIIERIKMVEVRVSSAINDLGSLMRKSRVQENHEKTLSRAALEAVDGKPPFAGLIHLEHSSKYDERPHVWRGITLHAHDRPFTVRILMQHIQTAISNLHPDNPTSGIALTEVALCWDHKRATPYYIKGRGGAKGSVQEDNLVSDSLEAMMARGVQGHIYVNYRLDKVDSTKWCGIEES